MIPLQRLPFLAAVLLLALPARAQTPRASDAWEDEGEVFFDDDSLAYYPPCEPEECRRNSRILSGETMDSNFEHFCADVPLAPGCSYAIEEGSPAFQAMNAIFYLASGNYEAAVTALDSVIAAAPTVAFYRAHRGYALAQTGDVSGAMWAFQEALLLDDRSAEVYFQRAAVKSNLGDARGALTDLRLAVELDPDDYRFHLLRARSFLLTRDYDGAYEAAEASVATSGDQCAECYLTAGVVRFTIGVPGDVETGCQYLSRAGELGSEEAYGYIGEWCGPAR